MGYRPSRQAARPLYERALASCEKALGTEHPNTNRVRYKFARLQLAAGNPAQALALGEVALTAHQKVLQTDHRWIKDSARVAADALARLGRDADAAILRARHNISAKIGPPT